MNKSIISKQTKWVWFWVDIKSNEFEFLITYTDFYSRDFYGEDFCMYYVLIATIYTFYRYSCVWDICEYHIGCRSNYLISWNDSNKLRMWNFKISPAFNKNCQIILALKKWTILTIGVTKNRYVNVSEKSLYSYEHSSNIIKF